MKRMSHVLKLVTICMLIMAFGLTGLQNADAKTTLTWWHLWGGTRTELIEKLATDYQAMNPDVEFEVTFTPPNEMQKKIVQAAGTGTLPDIFTFNTGWYDLMSPKDTMLSLDEYLKKDAVVLEDILVAAEAKRSYYQESVYSLPNVNAGGNGLFFYNEGLIAKAGLNATDMPTNWEEFTAASKTIVEKLNTGDQLDVIAWDPNQMAGQPAVIMFSWGAGFPTVSEDGKTSLMNSAGVVETAKKFDAYVEEVYGKFGGYKALLEWNSRIAGADTGAAQVQAFVKEAQVFYVSGSWTIGQVRKGNPDMQFGLMPVPGFNGQHGAIAKDGWSYAINKGSKQKDAAWDFLKFITIDPAGNGEFCKAQGRPSPIAAVNEDPHYTEDMGEMWTNLVASMTKDIVVGINIYHDTTKPWLRDFPARRIAGEPVEDIMEEIHDMFQSFLDDTYN